MRKFVLELFNSHVRITFSSKSEFSPNEQTTTTTNIYIIELQRRRREYFFFYRRKKIKVKLGDFFLIKESERVRE